ncbi:predicted protein [Sclerotinia sclerotiorum 1980 UF-70]|uniref:Uncharacterized protein n=1 Tax=Sclerotinia sclerotiorum (strain ATCC 18683 / 1980 / Ss-1) TaxID=665079 RepID=A7EA45_SCLS1|nr:predicted protein [Sclerotinia sclerotiorum 1980 UF-70]EDN99323.1 predicted protein [Sclerotinia sclerotiorum 1980 UF-70]
MFDFFILTKPRGQSKTHLKVWERHLFAQMRRNTKNPYLHPYALPLLDDYVSCNSGGAYNYMDSEDAKKLQEAADEIIMQDGEDFVLDLSGEECADRRLMFGKAKDLFMEVENIQEVSKTEKIDYVPRRGMVSLVFMYSLSTLMIWMTGQRLYQIVFLHGMATALTTALSGLSEKRSWF